MNNLWLQFVVWSMFGYFGQLHAAQDVRPYQHNTSPPKLSLASLPKNLVPLSINNHSDILVRDRNHVSLAILSHGKLVPIRVKNFGGCAMNDKRDVLVESSTGGQTMIWSKGNSHVLKLPTGYSTGSPCIDDNGEILVFNQRGAFGFYKNGKVTLLCRGVRNYLFHANSMNDSHQVVGVIQGPFGNSTGGIKPVFTSRPFLWDKGKLRYLKCPRVGFVYPVGINDHGQIVGEYRPEHGNLQRYAVLWTGLSSPMVDMNTLAAPSKSWHLSANVGCNDNLQIIGYGQKNGNVFDYLCSVSSAK